MADVIAYLINPVSHDQLRLAISQRRFLTALKHCYCSCWSRWMKRIESLFVEKIGVVLSVGLN